MLLTLSRLDPFTSQGDVVKSIEMQGLCLYLRPAGSSEERVASGVLRDEDGQGQKIPEVAGVDMLLQPLDGVARLSLETGKLLPMQRDSKRLVMKDGDMCAL